ncbi:MAG: 2OG-Fe(II) oxygenase [Solirubrobacteraceae bacterium]|nr:2OG-Fe(II) oxygenase [Solirubrobacteraceae bacterium]
MGSGGPTATSELSIRVEGFLAPARCRELIAEIDAARQAPAEVWLDDAFGVHPGSRMGRVAQLGRSSEAGVQQALWEVMPRLEQRFGCEISHLSGIAALTYRDGDHFAPHRDSGTDDPPDVSRRRVSLVVALNDGAHDFAGGELQLFAGPPAAPGPPRERVCSRPGMLVAFRSATTHRVTPVFTGCRYALASWALAPG